MKVLAVTVKIKAEKIEVAKEFFKTFGNASRSEAGCLHYEVFQSLENPQTFHFFEKWTDNEAFEKHGSQPFLKEFHGRYAELLEEPNKRLWLDPLESARETEESQVVDRQLRAYNSQDIDAFCACYDSAVQTFLLPQQEPDLVGMKSFRDRYALIFKESPHLCAIIKHRKILGSFVIDEEFVTGRSRSLAPIQATAIYEVKRGLIHKVWFLK